jgi:error-prone DNA polymerase
MKMRAPKGEGALTLADLDGQTSGLVALAGRELLGFERYGVGGLLDPLVGIFGRSNVYVEIQRHLLRDEEVDNRALIDLAGAFHVPVLATNGVRFAVPSSAAVRRARASATGPLARAGRKLARNAGAIWGRLKR